ncbi:MAG: hypothetical protein IJX88_02330 [Clostridia bacterium]|nr:hypothetical protein [Clostridia bacterium]
MFKRFIALSLSCLFAIGSGVLYKLKTFGKLNALAGERTYYLYSASSSAIIKTDLSFQDVFFVRGESVTLSAETDLSDFTEKVGARLVKTETVCGVTSLYYCVEEWQESVYIEGKRVNLHIATDATRTTVGTPVIFGGF